MDTFEARCPCGSVTLQLEGEPLGQVFCHCDDCQNAHGAAYVPRAIYPVGSVTVAAGATSSWVNRVRTMIICSACGSHLYGEIDGTPFRGVNAGLFPPGKFKPRAHIHTRYAVAPVVDDLPHYRDIPSEHGGTGELIGW
ncbi:GFA family protein [Allosphingosinicella deserti]|uniref:Aldehyde-activating protein n=1 Tax=Allosphingosinicella deserti TaxID=2116704 RepID=A0A2P7QFP3_9SPHN|nr:aldehyde-activating protein [Sphingomonas deserti]